jgi:hypothetical protein
MHHFFSKKLVAALRAATNFYMSNLGGIDKKRIPLAVQG